MTACTICSVLTHVERILDNQAAKLIIAHKWEPVRARIHKSTTSTNDCSNPLSLWTHREIRATFSIAIQTTLSLSCQMDKDGGLCARPAGRWSRGEVVRTYQEMSHQ